jgi:uncharacterized membrane protein
MSEIPPSDPGPDQQPEQPRQPEEPGQSPMGASPFDPADGQATGPDQYAAYPRQSYAMPAMRSWDFSAIGIAWQLITKSWLLWAANGLIYLIVISLIQFASFTFTFAKIGIVSLQSFADPKIMSQLNSTSFKLTGFGFAVLGAFVGQLYMMGSCHMALKQLDGGQIDANDVLNFRGKAGAAIIASIVSGVIISLVTQFIPCLGVILLFFLLPLFSFAGPFILEKDMGGIQAIGASAKETLPGLAIAGIVIFATSCVSALGIIACFVGLAITLPILPVVVAVTYRRYHPLGEQAYNPSMPFDGQQY